MWWKKHKWKVIVPAAIVLVLAAAFWYGGDAPSLRGWSVTQPTPTPTPEQVLQATPEVTPDKAPESTPMLPEETPEPTAAVTPEATPEPTLEPTDDTAAPEPPAETQAMVIDPDTGKDKYLTDPVPEGKPAPVEPENAVISDIAHTCTISISCATILDHIDWLDAEKVELVPDDGWILQPTAVTFYEGESVFNVLQRTCKQNGIHMEFENTPIYNSAYIEGINNLYEFDCGELSGWMYKVNEWFPNYGCSRYQLMDGDVICWVYTCDLGKDVGGTNAVGG